MTTTERLGVARFIEPTSRPTPLVRAAAALILVASANGVLLLLATVGTRSAAVLDQTVLDRLLAQVGGATGTAHDLLSLTTNTSVLLALAVLVVVALLRRRPALAVGAAVVVVGGSATTAAIKAVTGGSLPSGHVTAIAALVCAAALVAPGLLRPVILALGVVVVAAEAVATMILGWHLPMDVVAGVLVAVGWTAAVVLVAPRRTR